MLLLVAPSSPLPTSPPELGVSSEVSCMSSNRSFFNFMRLSSSGVSCKRRLISASWDSYSTNSAADGDSVILLDLV